MRALRSRAAAFALALTIPACGGGTLLLQPSTSPAPTAGFLTYTDAANGFTIGYPPGWEKKQGGDLAITVFLSPAEGPSDDFRENVNVLIQDIPADMTLDQYTDLSIRQGKSLVSGFTVLRTEATTLSGGRGTRLFYLGKPAGQSLEFEAVWIVRSGKAFVITFTGTRDSFSQFLAEAEGIMFSFQLR